MQPRNTRSDLASDIYSSVGSGKSISGAELQEYAVSVFPVTELRITEGVAADLLCKPVGTYYTMDISKYTDRSGDYFSAAANCIAELLREFPAIQKSQSFLIACLGNENVTPDAVGPLCADSLIVTRHLKLQQNGVFSDLSSVAVCRTGVLGTSGIESADTVAALCREIMPDCVIAVDALATSELNRLCKTVQLCDSGIAPGSGVGNNRSQLNTSTLGVPVIAVGVPTVIDASVFSNDEVVKGLFVTPRNIDELVASAAKLVAYGINLAVHRGLSIDDINMLVE